MLHTDDYDSKYTEQIHVGLSERIIENTYGITDNSCYAATLLRKYQGELAEFFYGTLPPVCVNFESS